MTGASGPGSRSAFIRSHQTVSRVMFPPGNMWRIGNGTVVLMLLNRHIA
jgi:hypothetical protein